MGLSGVSVNNTTNGFVNIGRYFHAIKYLKWVQIRNQLKYRFLKQSRHYSISHPIFRKEAEKDFLGFKPFFKKATSYEAKSFVFLNKIKDYTSKNINWNEGQYGLLWTYNLNYMDFLLQEKMEKETGLELIHDYIKNLKDGSIGLDPYPVSLRGINWVKFLSVHKVTDHTIHKSLFSQYDHLSKNPEYHLLGNHLLENAFSLLFGAFYFHEKTFYVKAQKIIKAELEEQILDDGAHFELSPMYHQIILDRMLDSINLLKNNFRFDEQDSLLKLLEGKTLMMLAWLNNITFQNGEIPHFNDSVQGIAPTSTQLFDYARRLNINGNEARFPLSQSGYRRFTGKNYECIVDAGPLGPDYIPGHAHADMLSFVLHVNQKPVIVDTGISTYEINDQRLLERSTISHNTVVVGDKNQSDVWGAFRVGKRAQINVIRDEKSKLEAVHNGFRPVKHFRKFEFTDSGFTIEDTISDKDTVATSFLHFNSGTTLELSDNTLWVDKMYKIEIKNATAINIESYQQAIGFNNSVLSNKLIVRFKGQLTFTFLFK